MIGLRSQFREISQDRLREFIDRGYEQRLFFPHRIYYLPKCGPDGLKMASRMQNIGNPNQQWEMVLYATGPILDEFPYELFFDDNIIWHQQQMGRPGHIATANLVIDGNRLYTMNHLSDLVQRISRKRSYKTRVENRFKGWHHLVLNGILNFALENQLQTVCTPTADFAIRHTDPKRTVQRELFDRVYDRAVLHRFKAVRGNDWWQIDVRDNVSRIIIPEKKVEPLSQEKTICLAHDIERGFGQADPAFSKTADQTSAIYLDEMLDIENKSKVRATYLVVGCMINEVRDRIESHSHCLGFHSYNHDVQAEQLPNCRAIDYRIKGYRPPQSKIAPELSDENLCYHNFEWLASSCSSLGMLRSPFAQNRAVKIPIGFDDFDLYSRNRRYEDWEEKAIDYIMQHDFVAFCLHDCYGFYWLPHYKDFIEKIRDLGTFKTMDEVAHEIILAQSF